MQNVHAAFLIIGSVVHRTERIVMTDLVFIGLIVAFFAASFGLVRFCASLLNRKEQR
jgi:hypothetical protein